MDAWLLDDLSKIRDVISRLENYDPTLFKNTIEFLMSEARKLELKLGDG